MTAVVVANSSGCSLIENNKVSIFAHCFVDIDFMRWSESGGTRT